MRVVFLRCGWMKRYAGVAADDPRPIGGGAYVKHNLGHERFNFKRVRGRLYGRYQPNSQTGGLNLGRIEPGADEEPWLDGVLVVFVATHPHEGGQRVVGWYRDARAHAIVQPPDGLRRDNCSWQVECEARDAVLLPVELREWLVPMGAGGMGTTHVRYPYDDSGRVATEDWMHDIVGRIERYDGPNLLLPLSLEFEREVAEKVEQMLDARGGFRVDPQIRRAVELHAMEAARKHFQTDGWDVEETSARHPYDLRIRRGHEVVQVEVKGTTGAGTEVVLTRGEVEAARVSHPAHQHR